MAAATTQQPPRQPRHPFRVRTVTAFLQLPADSSKWEAEVAAAGRFLAHAQQHLESLGYEVQTVRIATQPFPAFLAGSSSSSSSSGSSGGSTDAQHQHQREQQHQQQQQTSASLDDIMVTNAVLLESLVSQHGIPLVSLGSSSDPQHLTVIPRFITATKGTSCTFALPAEADWGLAYRVAEVVMRIAGETDGMGNFRFGSASTMQPGIPYFPVACCGPDQHRTFAVGTEADALLHQAFTAAAAMAAGAAAGPVAAVAGGQGGAQPNILQLAEQQLHAVLLQHLSPLQEAALQIQDFYQQSRGSSGSSDSAGCFRYLGLDTSLAPGLDTPPLTDSYQSLLQHMLPARAAADAGAGDTAVAGASVTAAAAAAAFGGPGSLTVSSLITSVLKRLPLRLTGYCGLMLAVCEDQGLAAAAAAGSITISQLLQYSAVCGCGLDTVPVPGPTPTQHQQQQPLEEAGVSGQPAGCDVAAAAAAQDAATTAAIAGLVADVNTLAHRLNKPLACRLLPLPGKLPGQPTDFHHPYMINSRVMDLHK